MGLDAADLLSRHLTDSHKDDLSNSYRQILMLSGQVNASRGGSHGSGRGMAAAGRQVQCDQLHHFEVKYSHMCYSP